MSREVQPTWMKSRRVCTSVLTWPSAEQLRLASGQFSQVRSAEVAAGVFDVVDHGHHLAEEWDFDAEAFGVGDDRLEVRVDFGAAFPDGEVAPDPAVRLFVFAANGHELIQ